MEWDNQKYKRTIPINHKTRNVGIITTPAGKNEYLHEFERHEKEDKVIAFPTTIESNEEIPAVANEEERENHDITSTKIIPSERAELKKRADPFKIYLL